MWSDFKYTNAKMSGQYGRAINGTMMVMLLCLQLGFCSNHSTLTRMVCGHKFACILHWHSNRSHLTTKTKYQTQQKQQHNKKQQAMHHNAISSLQTNMKMCKYANMQWLTLTHRLHPYHRVLEWWACYKHKLNGMYENIRISCCTAILCTFLLQQSQLPSQDSSTPLQKILNFSWYTNCMYAPSSPYSHWSSSSIFEMLFEQSSN